MKRKVLFFLPAKAGGAERVCITIAKMLDNKAFEIVFVLVCKEIENIVDFIPENCKIIHIRIRNIWDFTAIRIAKIICREKPEVIYGCMCYLNPHVILGTKFANKKVRIVVRNDNFTSYFGVFQRFYMRTAYQYADWIIAQQDEMKEDIVKNLRIDKKKVIVLQNPIDTLSIEEKTKEESPYSYIDNSIKYLQVGRVSEDKSQDVLLKAFKCVHDENPNTRLDIIGAYNEHDSYYQNLVNYIKANNLYTCVHFWGFDNNPYKWMKNADCFVLTSKREGLPNVLIEAMYIGLPVVATTCIPVIERIVQNNYNGILVKVDDVDGIAKAMKQVLKLKNYSFAYHSAKAQDFISLFTN